jgi:pilus assembly protein CpaF
MPDEQKQRNIPATPLSSLMGQMIKHKQGERLPAVPQQRGILPGQSDQVSRPPINTQDVDVRTNVEIPAGAKNTAATVADSLPNIAEIDAVEQLDESDDDHDMSSESRSEDRSKLQTNLTLIRQREKEIIEQLRRELDTARITQVSEETQSQVRTKIREMVNSDPAPLTMMEKSVLLQNVLDEVFGYGPLGPLLRDPSIGDICVNGPSSIYVERHGRLEKTQVVFENERHLRQTIDKIIQPLGRRLDENSPMVDARLPNGSRVNATIPPVSIDGPTLTIRCFGTAGISLGALVQSGSASIQMAEVLKACIKGRINMIISGGTGSGKTTLLNALSAHINSRERIITIEDAAELKLQHDHWIRMETRPPNTEGKGQITQRMCLINCLRMRPDRIILGECRGDEAFDMLQAMNTGHGGSLTTIHANSPRDATKRLENMILMAGMDMPARAARELIASALQVVIQIRRLEDGTRRITEIGEIVGMEGDVISINTLFTLEREGRDSRGFFKCKHVSTGLPPKFQEQLEQEAIPFNMDWMH